MIVHAINVGADGKATLGEVDLPAAFSSEAKVETEVRQPGDWGNWHRAKNGTATILFIKQGEWEVELPDGTTRKLGAGAVIVSQDGDATDDASGHRSRAIGELHLLKVTVPMVFPALAA